MGFSAQVRLEYGGDCHLPACLLIIFQYGNERAPYCHTGTIQRVHELGFAISRTHSCLHPSRLKVAEVTT